MITPFQRYFVSFIPRTSPVCVFITHAVPSGDVISQVAW
jgi:hypothetical protein